MGLAGAAVVIGTIFGVRALREKRDFDAGDKTTERVEAVEKNALLSDMAFGTALAFGVAGLVLWLNRQERPGTLEAGRPEAGTPEAETQRPPTPRLIVAPSWALSAPGASVLVRF